MTTATAAITETVTVDVDIYAISVTFRNYNPVTKEYANHTSYFKADRYSCYNGRLQTEWRIVDARHFKTEANARAAIGRLVAKKTIKPEHNPAVVRYTESTTRRYETMGA